MGGRHVAVVALRAVRRVAGLKQHHVAVVVGRVDMIADRPAPGSLVFKMVAVAGTVAEGAVLAFTEHECFGEAVGDLGQAGAAVAAEDAVPLFLGGIEVDTIRG